VSCDGCVASPAILFDMSDLLRAEIGELQPRRTWASVTRNDEVWRRTEDIWDLLEPPEDHALPPDLCWTEELRQLALSEYRSKFDKYLEPGQHHDITWPPEGTLITDGNWHIHEPDPCSKHGDDYDDNCDDCACLDRDRTMVIEHNAEWEWTIEVQTWERRQLADGTTVTELVETEQWAIGCTQVNPCDVEYGPVKASPERAALEYEFWNSGGTSAGR
jgi:hypothetical protein